MTPPAPPAAEAPEPIVSPAPRAGLRAARRATLRKGLELGAPVQLGILIWGFVTGLAMVQAGLSVWQAALMSVVVYSGTAQLAALPLLVSGVSLPVIWLTVVLANLRFVMYSVPVANAFGRYPLRWRMLFGYLTTDAGLVMFLDQLRSGSRVPRRARLFLSINVPLYLCWHVASLAGIAAATQVPQDPRWSFVATLAVAALIGPLLRGRAEWACVVVAAAVGVLLQALPWKIGLFFATAAGLSMAVALGWWQSRQFAAAAARSGPRQPVKKP